MNDFSLSWVAFKSILSVPTTNIINAKFKLSLKEAPFQILSSSAEFTVSARTLQDTKCDRRANKGQNRDISFVHKTAC